MKTVIYLINAFIVIFLSLTLGNAQDFEADMRHVYDVYSGRDLISLSVSVKIYSTENSKPVTQTAEMKKKGNLFLYKMEGSEMLITENDLILTSHGNKNIMKRTISPEERAAMQQRTLVPVNDSTVIKQQYDSVQFILTNSTEKKYTIYDSKSLVNKTEVFFDSETGAMTKMIYYYKKNKESTVDRVEVVYSEDPNPGSILTDALFSEELYIVPEEGKYKPASKFSNYKLTIVNP
jgi:hypothetical protein